MPNHWEYAMHFKGSVLQWLPGIRAHYSNRTMNMNLVRILVLFPFHWGYYHSVMSLEQISSALSYFSLRNINTVNALLCRMNDARAVLHHSKKTKVSLLTNFKVSKYIKNETLAQLFLAQPLVTGVIVDLDCLSSWESLHQLPNHAILLNGSYVFALLTDNSIDPILRALEDWKIAFDSDIALFAGEEIHEVYRTASGRPLIWSNIGHYHRGTRQAVLVPRPRRTDLQGITLRATTVVEFSTDLFGTAEWYDHWYETWRDVLSRFPCRQHKSMEQYANFSTVMKTAPIWGYYNASSGSHGFSKNSMYGDLGDNKADFGLTLSWMWSKRLNTAYFAPPTHHFRAYAVFRHPPAGSSFSAFARPFAWSTWLTVWALMLVGSGCLYATRRMLERDAHPSELTYSTCFFAVSGFVCLKRTLQEGTNMISTRVVILFLQLLALMVYSYYGTTILGFLLTPSPRTITTVEKLLDSGLDLWMENASFNRPLIKAGLSTKALKYYDQAIKGPTEDKDKIINRLEGLRMVQKGGAALYGVTPNLYKNIKEMFSSPEICSLYYMELLTFWGATAIQKQSPYRELYTRATLWLMECGLNSYEHSHWIADKPICVGQEINPAVRWEATFIGQIIFIAGLALSLMLFVLEKALRAYRKENK